ncbi:MAG: S8 family serine peptidase, partial [Planctomycetota bacterium]|nr:S8 family serine peptidase [Planctomycetota bacterium]
MPVPRCVLACACLPVLAGGLTHADPDVLLIKTTRASTPFQGSGPTSAPARPGATSGVPLTSGILDVAPVFDPAGSDAGLVERIGLDRWVRASLEPGADPAQVAERLRGLPFVELVEVDRHGTLATIPNDPLFSTQWNLRNTGQPVSGVNGVQGADVRAFQAWDTSTGGEPVVVATLDSGLYPHTELTGRIQPGYNMVAGSTDTSEVCGAHGTKVAGIIAAAGDNGLGIAGVNWTAVVMPIVVSSPCSVSQAVTAASIVWAVDNGARVINMSLQFTAGNEVLRDAVQYAAASEVVMVAASGNTGFTVSYPAYWPETIAVGAITNTDQRWSGSGVGYELDLVAPGVDVPTTGMFDSYTQGTGTSFAAPHVA